MTTVISCDLARAAARSDGETKDWTAHQIKQTVHRYEKYFALMVKHPGEPFAPTRDIDAFWHLHMLSPAAYYRDCMNGCGQIIDHDGGFGHCESELPKLLEVFDATAQRWEQMYDEPYCSPAVPDAATKCWHDCVSRCHNACKSTALDT